MNRWKDKVAIVTGASAGIGAAIAEALVKEGLQVVGLARRVEQIEELAERLSDEAGKLHAVKADLTNEEEILDAFTWTLEKLGPISILINNAGLLKMNTGLIEGETAAWKEILETNVLGLCITTREAVSTMIKCGIDGHVIHIGSTTAQDIPDIPGLNVYPASKAAVNTLAETLRQDFDRNGIRIKISCISPGIVATDMAADILGENPGVPHLYAEDIAYAVLYVLSSPPHVLVTNLTIKPVGQQS